MYEYLIILGVIFLATFILETIYRVRLYRSGGGRIKVVFILFVIGVAWDHFAIWRGHWLFPPDKNLGIKIGLMPLEEYLFIFVVPYFIITVYKLIDSKYTLSTRIKNYIRNIAK